MPVQADGTKMGDLAALRRGRPRLRRSPKPVARLTRPGIMAAKEVEMAEVSPVLVRAEVMDMEVILAAPIR